MTFRERLLSRTPMAMIMVATREHYRGWVRWNEDIETERALYAQLNGAAYTARLVGHA